ncbi:MAG TPA: hypothetical protein VKM94_18140 [Blastocatellia bacterium]|nr:hypothetical protein [Blastocatellia bacterium]
MSSEQPIAMNVRIEVEGEAEELDRATRQLLAELREHNVESADLIREDNASPGTKAADPVTLGAIALVVLPTVLPKIVEFLQSWVQRGVGRSVKFKGKFAGQDIEFEGSPKDLKQLLTEIKSTE